MRHITLAAALAFGLAGMAQAGDPVEGTWQTRPDDNGNFGHVEIRPCGDRFCGTLVRAYDSKGQRIQTGNVGKRIVWDMAPMSDGTYGKGKVWAPDRNKTYNSKMQLRGNVLSVSGCVFGICRDGGSWRRVE
ncbi:uncharacterized protein (DUF2147 family) [Rhodovulum imhoffii]|uniref:Uncharacterized protein (DUF2147 family) n=1 Tax=Rhodovulum imhoffii TaxID=365340 RepID=A0A2T5BR51_9RHOB|nr:DUF2147 domain-containing protein [Rhodovulum imhoffii]MBK5934381.1 imidazoleglycerol-phosphate dehydratase [Rhodovulum imhoffii]PTN01726.1 uncharacterized protein (DUF2147 family) [Rhodovulum imhoffii]